MSRFFLLYAKVKMLLDFMSRLTKSSVMVTPSNSKAKGHICHGYLPQ